MRRRTLGALAGAMVLTIATAIPAGASPPHFLVDPTIGDFAPVTLNGAPQLTSAAMTPFVVIDDSGLGLGWNVTLEVDDFMNGTGPGCSTSPTATIPASTLSMDAPTVVPDDGGTTIDGVTSAGFTDFTTARTIIAATPTNGAGTYDVSPAPLRLVIPPDAYAGTYCALATISITTP